MSRDASAGRGSTLQREPIFTSDFVLVCLTSFASFMAMHFLLPTLPLYVKGLGGLDTDVGLILGVYSLSALASRFVAGPLLDLWGRKWPLLVGAFLYTIAMLLYNATSTVPSVIALRLFHGFGFGIVTTACSALAADLAPAKRRGEAMGYFGNFASIAMAIGPAIALWLIELPGLPLAGFPLLFTVSSAIAVLELLFVSRIRESGHSGGKRPALAGGLNLASAFCRDAFPIAFAMLFAAFTQGAILSFVPIYLSTENPQTVPLFFLAYATVMAVSRPFVGTLADRFDRRLVAIPLMLFCACGVALFAVEPSVTVAMLSAVIFGVGYGALNPTLLALVVDVVKPRERGAAMGTFMAAIDIGIGVGSIILGLVAQSYGYRALFLTAGAVGFAGVAYCIVYQRRSSAYSPHS